MLADGSILIGDIEALMKHKPFYIETKYDGERMMAHRLPDGSFKVRDYAVHRELLHSAYSWSNTEGSCLMLFLGPGKKPH